VYAGICSFLDIAGQNRYDKEEEIDKEKKKEEEH